MVFVWGGRVLSQPLPRDVTYLYYFEAEDVRLSPRAGIARYAFAPLPNERVTLVAYGLDGRIQPRITLKRADGSLLSRSVTDPAQPAIAALTYNARENELLFFDVERITGDEGLVRVMLFEGDPLNRDLTFLDSMNPLLPNRAFMVAGRDDSEGLRVLVEVLDVPFSPVKPQVFASRGTLEEMPPPEERLRPSDTFLWFNQDGRKIYLVHVSSTPEELTDATENVSYTFINVSNFLYFDYYFTVGAGSDPVRLLERDECAAFVSRAECVNASPSFGREERIPPPPIEEFFEEDDEIIILPEILPCDNGVGIIAFLSAPGSLAGTDCDDQLFGSFGNDTLRGGGGDDELFGNAGDDLLLGEGGNDLLVPGDGNDIVDGGDGFDTVSYATENHDFDIDLTDVYTVMGVSVTYTNANGTHTDRLLSIEGVITGSGNDRLIGNSENNFFDGGDGDDVFNAVGGNNTIIMGAGNDTVIVDSDQTTRILGGNNSFGSDDDTILFYDGASGQIAYNDGYGVDTFDFSNVTLSGIVYSLEAINALQMVYPGLIVTHQSLPPAVLIATDQNDTIFTSAFSDSVFLLGGDDVLFGSRGNDTLDGGAGNDLLSYQLFTSTLDSVIVNLITGIVNKSGGFTDTITGFENVIGTAGNDIITGDGNDNTILGLGGNDILDGGAGSDTLSFELFACASVSALGITLDIPNGTASGEGSDVFSNFEAYITTNCRDTVYMGTSSDTVFTRDGNDTLYGNVGDDVIDAGDGTDRLLYTNLVDAMTFSINADTATATNGTFTDTIYNVEELGGTAQSDVWYIENGLCPPILCGVFTIGNPSRFLRLISGAPTGTDTYDFAQDIDGNIIAEGYVLIENNVSDDVNAPLNPSLTNVWQQVGANMYVKLTNVLNSNCRSAGQDNFVNGTLGSDLLGTGATQLATCPSNEIFNGFAPIVPIFQFPFGFIFPANPYWSDYDVVSYQDVNIGVGQSIVYNLNTVATVSGTGGLALGTDSLIEIEGIMGNAPGMFSTGADRFTFNPSNAYAYFIDGLGGNDTLDFTGVSLNVTVNAGLLTTPPTGGFNDIPPPMQNVFGGVKIGLLNNVITSVIGGFGNDNIIGTTLNDTFNGGLGDDTIFGLGGDDTFFDSSPSTSGNDTYDGGGQAGDTLVYLTPSDAVTVNLTGAGDTAVSGTMTDTIIGIPNITTGGGNDTFNIARLGAGTLNAGNGANIFNISAANTFALIGGSSIDRADYSGFVLSGIIATLNGSSGTVTGTLLSNALTGIENVVGTIFNDTFRQTFDTVANFFSGGLGIDLMDYSTSTASLTATLNATFASSTVTSGVTDTLQGIEQLLLGSGADTVTMNADNGWQSVNTGAGDDTVIVNANNVATAYNGGAGTSDTLQYNLAATWAINGVTSVSITTGAITDTATNFENLQASNNADTLNINGLTGIASINAGGGNDMLNINAFGSSDFTFELGAGVDTVRATILPNAFDIGVNGASLTMTSGGVTYTANNAEILLSGFGDDTIEIMDDSTITQVAGGGGDDSFYIVSNGANTTYEGGSGTDTIAYDGALGSAVVNVGANATVTHGTSTDTLTGFEELTLNDGDDEFFIDVSAIVQSIRLVTTQGSSQNRWRFTGDATLANPVTVEIETSSGTQDTLDFNGVTGAGILLDMGSNALQDVFGGGNLFIRLVNSIHHVIGTEQADVIIGTNDADTIEGRGGDDTIEGLGGDDTLHGGDGDDTIDGGAGDDFITGGDGDDLIYGCAGNDTLEGNDGDDTIYGGCDNSVTVQDDGDDIIYGGAGNDTLFGGNKNTNVNIGAGGNDGNDIIVGGTGEDLIYGGNDNSGATLTTGGAGGDDTITTDDDSEADIVYGGNAGNQGDPGTNTLNSGVEDTVDAGNAP
jgi:Ca2+-binding RTX toxin-like protein